MKINMSEIKKTITEIYAILSNISVNGDSVEYMAASKAKLKAVYAELEKIGKDGEQNG